MREGEIVFGALDAKTSASSGSWVEDGPTNGPEWMGLGPECGHVMIYYKYMWTCRFCCVCAC